MSDEIAEIIPRPPSSPIGSTLLIVTTMGLILAIAIVWAELFGEYLPAVKPGQQPDPEMVKHNARQEAEKHSRDHYAEDFPGGDDMLSAVERDLQVSSKVGDLSAGSAGSGGSGDMGGDMGGEAPVDSPESTEGQ